MRTMPVATSIVMDVLSFAWRRAVSLRVGRTEAYKHIRCQNQVDLALRELGRIERTLFMLDGLESLELRRRCHAGLSKSEQRHFLAQVICTFKQGRQTRPDCRRSAEVPAVSCLQPQPRHRRDRVRELTYTAAGARCMARPYIAAQPGAHQLAIDTRRCPVEPGGGRSGRLTGNPCHAEPSKIPYRNTCRGRVS